MKKLKFLKNNFDYRKMEIKECIKEDPLKNIFIIERDENGIRFILDNATNELAALFRKILLTEVPTMAIYLVNVYKNTTMYETFNIIRTLRFIPLQLNPDKYIYTHECDCTEILRNDTTYEGEIIGGCDKCSEFFSLMVSNIEDHREITSKKLWCKEKCINVDIPIVRIKKDEELYLTAKAFKGKGANHAMWSPVTVVTFSQIESTEDEKEESYPQYKEDKKYDFSFEAVGNLSPFYILTKANEIYQKEKAILSYQKYDIRHRYLLNEHLQEEENFH